MADWFLTPFLVGIALLGHIGVIVAVYNRLNALGWQRSTIKLWVKVVFMCGLLIPLLFLWLEWNYGARTFPPSSGSLLLSTKLYFVFLIIFALIALPLWLSSRPQFVQAHSRHQTVQSRTWRARDLPETPFRGRFFRLLGKLPRNEVSWTEGNTKLLGFDEIPDELIDLRIAHISDIHLTGQMSNAFYHRAFDWLNEQMPDLVILAGDIVDYDQAIDDIQPILGRLKARFGLCFLLGNHDRRVREPQHICHQLTDMGWHDVGKTSVRFTIQKAEIEIVGNELPWFRRSNSPLLPIDPGSQNTKELWRIGVAHSPDQFLWGQQMGCRLLLCGHTHGGQIRFPVIGPLVSPSWHGSRFASGVFFANGTLMHVSRGLCGIHPLRWGCPPEVSILQLTKQSG